MMEHLEVILRSVTKTGDEVSMHLVAKIDERTSASVASVGGEWLLTLEALVDPTLSSTRVTRREPPR